MADHVFAHSSGASYPYSRDLQGQTIGDVEPGDVRDTDGPLDWMWSEATPELLAHLAEQKAAEQARADAEKAAAEEAASPPPPAETAPARTPAKPRTPPPAAPSPAATPAGTENQEG